MTTLATRASRLERATANLAFLSLFPGFFFYNFLLGTGRIRAFLGGYFAPVSLVFVLPLVFLYISQIKRDRNRFVQSELYFGVFLAFFSAVVAVNAASGANRAIVTGHVLAIMYMANALMMFKMSDFALPEFRYPAMLSLLGMSAIIIFNSVDGVFRLDALGMAKDPDSLSTYQGFARSYLVTFLCVIAYTKSVPLRVLIYLAGAASLFLNTARSEFVALMFAIPIIEFYFARQKLLVILVLASLATLIGMNLDLLLAQLPNTRILELLDLSHSSSALARHRLTLHAVQTISTYPLFGDYASYGPGLYSHNILSAWVDLGIFGFVYLLAILIVPATSMFITGYFSKHDCGDFVLGFSLVCLTMLLLVKSHYFTDMLIGAALGTYSRYNYGRRYVKNGASELRPSALRYPHLRLALPQSRRAQP